MAGDAPRSAGWSRDTRRGATGMIAIEWGQWTVRHGCGRRMARRTRPLRVDIVVKAAAAVGSGGCPQQVDELGSPREWGNIRSKQMSWRGLVCLAQSLHRELGVRTDVPMWLHRNREPLESSSCGGHLFRHLMCHGLMLARGLPTFGLFFSFTTYNILTVTATNASILGIFEYDQCLELIVMP